MSSTLAAIIADVLRHAPGRGVPQVDAEAEHWYRVTAAQDAVYAQIDLGFMYAQGQGVPRDHVRAYALFSIAAASGYDCAVNMREFLAQQLTPDALLSAQELSRFWFENPDLIK